MRSSELAKLEEERRSVPPPAPKPPLGGRTRDDRIRDEVREEFRSVGARVFRDEGRSP